MRVRGRPRLLGRGSRFRMAGAAGRMAWASTSGLDRLREAGAEGFHQPDPTSPDAHLAGRYGSLADEIRALIAFDPDLGRPLVSGHPYLRAEAVYAVRHEMATTLDDVLVRRTRVHLFDRPAALAAAPDVAALLAGELGWDADETERQLDHYRQLCRNEEAAVGAELTNTAD